MKKKYLLAFIMMAALAGSTVYGAESADTAEAVTFRAAVEIPAGSNIKYETDEFGHLTVDRFVSMAVRYPANYASVEGTLGGDGDPLDALVYTREPLTPGVSIECRPIGFLKMTDGGEADEKLIAVPTGDIDPTYDDIQDISDIPAIERERLEDFFATYKLLPEGSKEVVLDGFEGAEAAEELLTSAKEAYVPAETEWMNLNNYPQTENVPEEINVAIEIPQGGFVKYELDSLGYVVADRFQSTSVAYPANYGSIVSTTGGDNDPLDALVLARTPIHPGAVIKCRPIGVLRMVDGGEADEKIIAVPTDDVDPAYANVKEMSDLAPVESQRIEQFFANYKNLPQGRKEVELNGFGEASEAKELIAEAAAAFQPKEEAYISLNEYPQGENAEELNAVIEIPQGSSVKYEMDENGKILADRFQSMPVVYPANYGALPQTEGGDGDPLDVLVYTREPLVSGSVVAVRPVGVLKMMDDGEVDDKIIAVPVSDVDPTYDDVKSVEDLPEMERNRLEQFFRVYKILPKNVTIETDGYEGAEAALEVIGAALRK